MNDKRRANLKIAINMMSDVEDIISDVIFLEQISLNNIPENLQETERYENMENNIEDLTEVIRSIGEIKTGIEGVIYGQ